MSVLDQQISLAPGQYFNIGGGSGGGSSQFSTIGVSSLVASTIVTPQISAAVVNAAEVYTSTLSGNLSTTGQSTLLFTAPGAGTYSVHLNVKTGSFAVATWDGIVSCGAYEVAPGNTKYSLPQVVTQTGGSTYQIAPYGDQTFPGQMWFTTTVGSTLPYTGSYTRLNF